MYKILLAATMLSVSLLCQAQEGFVDADAAKHKQNQSAATPNLQNILAPDLIDRSEWKEKLQMGNGASNIETYLVSDWRCPACRMKEPEIERMLPKILQNSRVYFIDLANHPGSADFVKFNLSFLLNNKDVYLNLRSILNEFSQSGQAPTEAQINDKLAQFHVKYIPISKEKLDAISNYFRSVTTSLNVAGTPTFVLKNVKTKKTKSLVGNDINEQNVLKSLEEIEKQ